MKKICYVTTISLTLKSFVIKSAEYLKEHTDWDITVICDNDDEFAKSLPEGIRYIPVSMKRGISFDGISVINKLKKIFKEEKFDLVQYSTPNASFYASIAAKKAGISIRNYHLMGLRYKGINGVARYVFKIIEKKTCKNSTTIECVSNSNLKMALKDKLFEKGKATVIWNGSSGGVNVEIFDFNQREKWRKEIRAELGIDKDDFLFGFVGRITRDKGVNEIIEAFSTIDTGKLIFVGNLEIDNDEKTLKNIESVRKEKRVIFHGNVNEIEKYYAAIDVLLLPSYREGFGNVIIEAAAVGTPAIVSNIPGPIDAVKKNVTAILIEPRNTDDLKNAMIKIMESDYKTMGINAKEYVIEHFNSNKLNSYILQRKKDLLGIE